MIESSVCVLFWLILWWLVWSLGGVRLVGDLLCVLLFCGFRCVLLRFQCVSQFMCILTIKYKQLLYYFMHSAWRKDSEQVALTGWFLPFLHINDLYFSLIYQRKIQVLNKIWTLISESLDKLNNKDEKRRDNNRLILTLTLIILTTLTILTILTLSDSFFVVLWCSFSLVLLIECSVLVSFVLLLVLMLIECSMRWKWCVW